MCKLSTLDVNFNIYLTYTLKTYTPNKQQLKLKKHQNTVFFLQNE